MINEIHENKTIMAFYTMIPYMENFFGCELGFTISNTERFLYTQYNDSFKEECSDLSKMPKAGDKIPPLSAADVCLREKRSITVNVPEAVFGIPVKTAAVPVVENGEILGTMVIAISTKKQKEVYNLSDNLADSLTKIESEATDMASRFQEINSTNLGIEAFIDKTRQRVKRTDEIISFVNGVTHHINLLGLNASIEAARAGEVGKGFSVVAQEIGKLSKSTKQGVDEINDIMKTIQKNNNELMEDFRNSNELLETQVNGLSSIVGNIQNLSKTAMELRGFAEKL